MSAEMIGEGDHTDAIGSTSSSKSKVVLSAEPDSEFVPDQYRMNYKDLGTVLIINNKNFHPRTAMSVRTGTDVDAINMQELFQNMGFQKITIYDDLTASRMREVLQTAARQDHSQSSCFVCVILTHGEEGFVYGTDDKIALDQLFFPFKGNRCRSLAGKPKLFFIQACRGTELDPGVEIEEDMEVESDDANVRRIPTEADFLIAYSVVPGFFAWRNSTRGSWFIQAVYDVLLANWRSMDLLTMMTRVNKKVAYDFQSNANKEHMNNKKQIPCITSMLTKDVYFHQ